MNDWPAALGFDVPGVPIPKGRPRVGSFMTARGTRITRTRTPERTAAFEQQVALLARARLRHLSPVQGPVAVHIDCRFKRMVSAPDETGWHTLRPDADNVLKAVLDALVGVAFYDDSQVCFMSAAKHFLEVGDDERGEGVYVVIRPLRGIFPDGYPGELWRDVIC
jgi:Holliday junction resolvase RusA-like endonuclease